jgi:hypothetical protein
MGGILKTKNGDIGPGIETFNESATMVGLLIEAIKDQQSQIEELKNRLEGN